MSYILDALRKSDQQRQRGTTPTLLAAPSPIGETGERGPMFFIYGALAIVLVGAGILIGWLRPWQSEPPVATRPPVSSPAPLVAAVAPVSPATIIKPQPEVRAQRPTPPLSLAQQRQLPTDHGPEQGLMAMEDLPLAMRQELPPMTIALHAYSRNPEKRLVSINNLLLHEGGSPAPGVTLEQITPDGMILSYKGVRFRRGVQ